MSTNNNHQLLERLKSSYTRPKEESNKNNEDSSLASKLNSARSTRSSRNIDEILSNIKMLVISLKTISKFISFFFSHRRNDGRKSVYDETNKIKNSRQKHKNSDRKSLPSLYKAERIEKAEIPKHTNNNRSKTAGSKIKENLHPFYSNSWRVHSEFVREPPDVKARADPTSSIFFTVGRKKPETYILHPDWI